MRPSIPRPTSALRAGLLALAVAFLGAACLGTGSSIKADDGPKANPIALFFGGPLGCLLESSMRPEKDAAEPLSAPEARH